MYYSSYINKSPTSAANHVIQGCTTQVAQMSFYDIPPSYYGYPVPNQMQLQDSALLGYDGYTTLMKPPMELFSNIAKTYNGGVVPTEEVANDSNNKVKKKLVTCSTQYKPIEKPSKTKGKSTKQPPSKRTDRRQSNISTSSKSNSSSDESTEASNVSSTASRTKSEASIDIGEKSGKNTKETSAEEILTNEFNRKKKRKTGQPLKKISKHPETPIKKMAKAIMIKPPKKTKTEKNVNVVPVIPQKKALNKSVDNRGEHEVKRYKKSFIHFGNYLMPTFASSMKRNAKVRRPNILHRVPFVAAGSTNNKSHNLLMRLQENKMLGRKSKNKTVLDTNFNLYNLLSDTINPVRSAPTSKNYKLMLKYSHQFNHKTSAGDISVLPRNGVINRRGEDKNALVKNVLSTLYRNFTAKLAQYKELENRIKIKGDTSADTIYAFKELCDKVEDEENVIRAILFLINNVFTLNKKLNNWRHFDQHNTLRQKQTLLKRSKYTNYFPQVQSLPEIRKKRKGVKCHAGKKCLIQEQFACLLPNMF
ncbi:hypothetical protein O3M35_010160 [Rhynocoris fuscipes]|uniref:Uncharacterized protein n=1 Tax=Rhynocoris fuscipes TaxID=488301 RepID=A0AAW1D3C1_9HEMI